MKHEHYCSDCEDYWSHNGGERCHLPADAPCPEHFEVEVPDGEEDEE